MKQSSSVRCTGIPIKPSVPRKKATVFYQMLLAAMAGLALLASCHKGSDETSALPFPTPEPVSASFQGKVVDENGQPVADATVLIGSGSVKTDPTGFFTVQHVQVDKHAAFMKVEKEGFFTGSRTMSVTAGSSNMARIKLMKKKMAGEFTPAAGGAITVPDGGGSVQFPANAVVNPSSSQPYTGTVSVAARYLDPTADNITEIMPGELRAIANDGTERGLQSFAMMAVELTGTNGEKLQLASGKEASLTFPIPQELQNQAPQTIPLWYFDETKGLWKEEGFAKKEGNNYVGTVKHFSYWNCDLPYNTVDFEVAFKDEAGHVMPSLKVIIKNNDPGDVSIYGYEYTDQAGNIQSKIPANRNLKMIVLNQLGTELYSQAFTSTTGATVLGAISINTSSLPRLTLSGTVANCATTPVTNGFVAVQLDGQTYRAELNSNGAFSLTVERANTATAQAILTGYNLTDDKASAPMTINVTTGNAPSVSLTACNDPSEYINVVINNRQYHFNPIKDVITATIESVGGNGTPVQIQTHIQVWQRGKENLGRIFEMVILGSSVGEHTLYSVRFIKDLSDYSLIYSPDLESPAYPSKAIISKAYMQNGIRYQEGSFSEAPMIYDGDSEKYSAQGSYKLTVK